MSRIKTPLFFELQKGMKMSFPLVGNLSDSLFNKEPRVRGDLMYFRNKSRYEIIIYWSAEDEAYK